ncbi:phosphatidate cytidylyltransferase [Peredibacter sp. HCB2-198]|uniref:phosphatidate cytidylyltransferase n=1 Tax=Peredibacter sp. HCB2-198 TaxID=3383025 RepID=UPI0038B61F73
MNLDNLLSFAEFLTPPVNMVLGGIFAVLIVVTLAFYLARAMKGPTKLIKELIERTLSWWMILVGFTVTIFFSRFFATIALGFLAFVAFRELTSRLNLRMSDRRTLLWCYLAIPFQFFTAYIEWYGMFIIFIPVIMFVGLAMRSVAHGDVKGITASLGIIHWSAMLTIFSLSHLAYMLSLPEKTGYTAGNGGMILWLVLITECNDIFQFTWGKLFGKHKILPSVSPNKTVEGFLGGVISTVALGYALSFLLPIDSMKAAILSLILAFAGFMGDVTVSAIKRDLGIKDMGSTIPGHGGIMDRIDSLAFNALICFHLIRYWSYL